MDALFLRLEQNLNAKALFLQISHQKTADYTKHAQQWTPPEKQYKGLWLQNSLDWLTR